MYTHSLQYITITITRHTYILFTLTVYFIIHLFLLRAFNEKILAVFSYFR